MAFSLGHYYNIRQFVTSRTRTSYFCVRNFVYFPSSIDISAISLKIKHNKYELHCNCLHNNYENPFKIWLQISLTITALLVCVQRIAGITLAQKWSRSIDTAMLTSSSVSWAFINIWKKYISHHVYISTSWKSLGTFIECLENTVERVFNIDRGVNLSTADIWGKYKKCYY